MDGRTAQEEHRLPFPWDGSGWLFSFLSPAGYYERVLKDDSLDSGSGDYVTIPHSHSWATVQLREFETNVAKTSYLELIQRVLKTFMPGKSHTNNFTGALWAAAPTKNWRMNNSEMAEKMLFNTAALKMCDLTHATLSSFLPDASCGCLINKRIENI